jgi:hypothetical protein
MERRETGERKDKEGKGREEAKRLNRQERKEDQ